MNNLGGTSEWVEMPEAVRMGWEEHRAKSVLFPDGLSLAQNYCLCFCGSGEHLSTHGAPRGC